MVILAKATETKWKCALGIEINVGTHLVPTVLYPDSESIQNNSNCFEC